MSFYSTLKSLLNECIFEVTYFSGQMPIKNALMVDTASANAVKLKHIFDIYGLDQLITEPTRITLSSRSLIDLCITRMEQ